MTSSEVYKLFQSLKLHFNSKTYDFHKFKGNIKASLASSHKDFWVYQKLAERPKEELITLILANLIINPKLYIRELLNPLSIEEWNFWKERIENKYEVLLVQCKFLVKNIDRQFFQLELSPDKLCSYYYQKYISLESLVLLDYYYHFCEKESTHIIFENLRIQILKYKSFISGDIEKIQQIVNYIQTKYVSLLDERIQKK